MFMEKLNEEFVINLSHKKGEPEWMTDFRVNSYKTFLNSSSPSFGPRLDIDFDSLCYV